MPAVVDAILAAVNTAAPDTVGVYDGPFVTGDTLDSIHIGYDADPDGEGEAGTSAQDWNGLGAKARNETLTVSCAVHLLRGDPNVKAARDRAYELLALVENAIHPAPSLGLTPPCQAGVTSHRLLYLHGEDIGFEVLLTFAITIQTRL